MAKDAFGHGSNARPNHREFAQHGLMHPEMASHMRVGQDVDFYEHGTGDKKFGRVTRVGSSIHIKEHKDGRMNTGPTHKFKISNHLPVEKADAIRPLGDVVAKAAGTTFHPAETHMGTSHFVRHNGVKVGVIHPEGGGKHSFTIGNEGQTTMHNSLGEAKAAARKAAPAYAQSYGAAMKKLSDSGSIVEKRKTRSDKGGHHKHEASAETHFDEWHPRSHEMDIPFGWSHRSAAGHGIIHPGAHGYDGFRVGAEGDFYGSSKSDGPHASDRGSKYSGKIVAIKSHPEHGDTLHVQEYGDEGYDGGAVHEYKIAGDYPTLKNDQKMRAEIMDQQRKHHAAAAPPPRRIRKGDIDCANAVVEGVAKRVDALEKSVSTKKEEQPNG